MPYLIGPNKAPITPNKNKATNSNGSEFSSKPATATAAAPISASFSSWAIRALSKRSASSPPDADSKKNGAMKIAPAKLTSASPACPPILNRINKTSAFFSKLSLNAEKNWHQNNGAKRRDVRSDCDIDPSKDQDWVPSLPVEAYRCPGNIVQCRRKKIAPNFVLAGLDPWASTLWAGRSKGRGYGDQVRARRVRIVS